jgi:hypothetical protein
MGVFSYLRFVVGLLLSIEIIRQLLFGNQISLYATILASMFIALSVWFFVGKIILGH